MRRQSRRDPLGRDEARLANDLLVEPQRQLAEPPRPVGRRGDERERRQSGIGHEDAFAGVARFEQSVASTCRD